MIKSAEVVFSDELLKKSSIQFKYIILEQWIYYQVYPSMMLNGTINRK